MCGVGAYRRVVFERWRDGVGEELMVKGLCLGAYTSSGERTEKEPTMGGFGSSLKRFWLWMIDPPWRDNGRGNDLSYHWVFWLIGWAWAVVGLVGGALAAPSLVQLAGLGNLPYQDELVIGIAVVTGFLVQLLGWCCVALITASLVRFFPRLAVGMIRYDVMNQTAWMPSRVFARRRIVYYAVLALLPLAGVGYALYRYLTWVGEGQQAFTIAFVGALLVKAFLIPFVKGIITGAIFKYFVNWLRGNRVKARGA